MQIPKTLLTCGVAALCLAATSARAADTEADLKLREALRQRMTEVGPETSPKPPKAPKAPPAPAPAATASSAPVAPAVVVEPMASAPVVVQPAPVVAPASSSDDVERLRAAVRARLAAGETPATVAQPVATNGTDMQPVVSSTTVVTPAAPSEPAPAPAPAAPLAVVAPASPISGSKEQRLAALLQLYKADQITPQQYHEQRAKILAE